MLVMIFCVGTILTSSAIAQHDGEGPDPSFGELKERYFAEALRFSQALRGANGDKEKIEAARALMPDGLVHAKRFERFALKSPKADDAVEAIALAMQLYVPSIVKAGRFEAVDPLIKILDEHWSASERLKPHLGRVANYAGGAHSPFVESFLRKVIATNPDRDCQGLARYELADVLVGQRTALQKLRNRPGITSRFHTGSGTAR